MKYKDALIKSMENLAEDKNVLFLGYNLKFGSKGYGTLKTIKEEQILETPLAENLMTGMAIGLAIEGFRPVVFFERHDYMLIALDAIVNHLDKLKDMTDGEFKAPVIIRANVGTSKPIYPGPQHVQDFSEILKKIVSFPVYEPKNAQEILETYEKIKNSDEPCIIIERKEKYDEDYPVAIKNDNNQNEKLVLDGTKLAWHTERVNAWLRGEKIAPITIDMALTRRCNYHCTYCYGQLQANDEKKMTKEVIIRFLNDAAEIGVKAISFVSDGESTCSPYLCDAIIHGKKVGLDMALGTNGALLQKERFGEILPCLTYLRFNISAADSKRYCAIHGCRAEDYQKVMENIKEAVRIKKEKKLSVTIGLQMVLLPEFKDQIIPLAKLGKELGVDYLVIKHCSDDEKGSLGVKYDKYFEEDLIKTIKEAESYSTENYFVKAKWSKILSGGKRNYARCYGPPFIMQLSGSGLVAPCGQLFNDQYGRFHIGNIAEKSFKEIWKSDKYWEVMNFLSSEKFDARTMCGTLCLHHKVNEVLWDLKQKGIKQIEKPSGKPPEHINFI